MQSPEIAEKSSRMLFSLRAFFLLALKNTIRSSAKIKWETEIDPHNIGSIAS